MQFLINHFLQVRHMHFKPKKNELQECIIDLIIHAASVLYTHALLIKLVTGLLFLFQFFNLFLITETFAKPMWHEIYKNVIGKPRSAHLDIYNMFDGSRCLLLMSDRLSIRYAHSINFKWIMHWSKFSFKGIKPFILPS